MRDNWTTEELRAAVAAYLEMHGKAQRGERFVKKRYYRELAEQFGRTDKSFEFRMQNISYVFEQMGLGWVSGLKPAKHVGSRTMAILEGLIRDLAPLPEPSAPETNVPQGVQAPQAHYRTTSRHERSQSVREWVLTNAAQRCESCGEPAPFLTAAGEPFLEVHHLKGLADGGSDTVSNTVALCPNCHRELHHGRNKLTVLNELYRRHPRLVKE
ncbi:HNH endonuclease [Aeromonas enteropelogenes]|uniref:HNH endonuclease n=1 Tax=Aeromonas enteropelogenes TaxID=29489 RepID=UPI003B9E6A57